MKNLKCSFWCRYEIIAIGRQFISDYSVSYGRVTINRTGDAIKVWSANSAKIRIKLLSYNTNKYDVYLLDGKVQKNQRILK